VYYRYAGAAHPEHALSSGAVLTSYSRNPRDGALLTANGNAYMPQWVEVAPSAVTAPAPSTAALAVPQTSAEQNDPVRRKRPPDAQDPRGLVRLAR
jgi:hypothetical protein